MFLNIATILFSCANASKVNFHNLQGKAVGDFADSDSSPFHMLGAHTQPSTTGRRLSDDPHPPMFSEKSKTHHMVCGETDLLPPTFSEPIYEVVATFNANSFEACVDEVMESEDPAEDQMIIYYPDTMECNLSNPFPWEGTELNCYLNPPVAINTCFFGEQKISCAGPLVKKCYLTEPGEVLIPMGHDIFELGVSEFDSMDECIAFYQGEFPGVAWSIVTLFDEENKMCKAMASDSVQLQTVFEIIPSGLDESILTCANVTMDTVFAPDDHDHNHHDDDDDCPCRKACTVSHCDCPCATYLRAPCPEELPAFNLELAELPEMMNVEISKAD
eukprot:GHVH01016214.1.p1 GENE.GHVH01016214.1~~GHVH01016214.1.p1  ORF type:complete len:331 (+),score=45.04 GHVH01016214.1:48-1040(+)